MSSNLICEEVRLRCWATLYIALFGVTLIYSILAEHMEGMFLEAHAFIHILDVIILRSIAYSGRA